MPVRRNSAYNDPAIGQAFDNLASMFGPPKASDVYAYAHARAAQQGIDLKNQAAAVLTDPNSSADARDRLGALAGLFNPTQGFGARDMTDATTRRGQDVSASTSITNNTADNARAIATNTADNARALDVAMVAPVAAGATRFNPPKIQDLYKVAPAQIGVVSEAAGSTGFVPGPNGEAGGGGTLSGTAIAPTLEQAKAAELQKQRASGQVTDPMMTAMIFGNTPVDSVQTPDGPRNVTRPESIGQAPLGDPTKVSELATLQNERAAIERQNPSDPRIAEYRQRIDALGRGQQQGAYDKANDESLAKLNEGIYTNAQSASSNVATLDKIQQLVDQTGSDQGKWANARLEVRKGLRALGIEAGDTSPLEVQRALASRFALQLRDPSQGAGMPGAMSDADRQFLASMTPGIENSPNASKAIIDIYRRLNKRTIDIENMRRAYVQKNGRLDEGFRSSVSDFVNANPLFAQVDAPGSAGLSTGAGAAQPGAAQTRAPAAVGAYPEGMQIENDAGERMIRRSGKWERL